MSIKTKKVQGRRTVRYESIDELRADAKRFSGSDIRTVGNWSQGQIFKHLARSLDSSIDRAGFSFPAPVQWLMSLLMKGQSNDRTEPSRGSHTRLESVCRRCQTNGRAKIEHI